MDANTSLSLSKSQHQREIDNYQDQANDMVDIKKFNNLNMQVVEQDRRVRELEEALESRAADSNKLLLDSQNDHRRAQEALEEEKADAVRKLQKTQDLLNQQVQKLKDQVS